MADFKLKFILAFSTLSLVISCTADAKEDTKNPGNKIFSKQELAKFNGHDPNLPIYIAVKGVVFDVSEGKDFYGVGAGYNVLAGRDCSRAVALWSLEEKDMTDNLEGLTTEQLESLDQIFYGVYMKKYRIVGYTEAYNTQAYQNISRDQEEL